MFTIKDEVQNPEGISATDISYGDGTVAEALDSKQDAGDFVVFDPATFTSALVVDGGGTQAFQINVDNKDDTTYDRQAINFNKDSIIKYVRSKSDGKWKVDATFTADEDSNWIELAANTEIYYRKKNSIVFIRMFWQSKGTITKGYKQIGTLPEGYRPTQLETIPILMQPASETNPMVMGRIQVNPTGQFGTWSPIEITSGQYHVLASGSYIAA